MTLIYLLCWLGTSSCIHTPDSGVDGLYLITEEKKCSSYEIKFKRKSYCITEEPVISIDHFIKITSLRNAGETVFFDVDLDKTATRKLNLVQTKLHRLKFALILNSQMKGWIKLDYDEGVSQLRFYSTSFGNNIVETQAYLEKVIATNKKE